MLDLIEDNTRSQLDEALHVQSCINETEMVQEILKCKTIKQIASEKNKSLAKVCNILMKEKREIEQIL